MEPAKRKEDVMSVVGEKIRAMVSAGDIDLPPGYSAPNALKEAWLILRETQDKQGRPVLETCSRESIAAALLDMVVQGLSPGRQQCYFIAYGRKLTLVRSYYGDLAILRRVAPKARVYAQVVYRGDTFSYRLVDGRKVIAEHEQTLENMTAGEIVAAYAVVDPGDGSPPFAEVMTIDQIKKSWSMRAGKETRAQTDFPEEMAKKTVIRRAVKAYIRSAGEPWIAGGSEEDLPLEARDQVLEEEVEERANETEIDVTQVATVTEPEQEGEAEEIETPF